MLLGKMLSRSPGHPCRVINPICPILASVREDTRVADILYFRALLLIRSAQADNQKMYIKRYNDQILSIIGDIYSQNRVGSRGLSVPDETVVFKIIPSQMEVAPLHCTVDITQKRRLFKNTKEIEKM